MILPIFATPLYKTQLEGNWNKPQILERLESYFAEQTITGYVNRELFKEELFKPIVEQMDRAVAEYWNELDYTELYPVAISQLWANKYIQSSTYPHNLENDSPSTITVVVYIEKDCAEQGNLFFANPNELLLQTQPLSTKRRYDPKHKYYEFDGRTGDLICFPSWLQHGIYPNTTTKPRFSMAANYELRGLPNIKKILSKK